MTGQRAGRVLSRMMLDCDGKLAWTYVTLVDYRETGAEPPDTEDLVNECLTVGDVEAGRHMHERADVEGVPAMCSYRTRISLLPSIRSSPSR